MPDILKWLIPSILGVSTVLFMLRRMANTPLGWSETTIVYASFLLCAAPILSEISWSNDGGHIRTVYAQTKSALGDAKDALDQLNEKQLLNDRSIEELRGAQSEIVKQLATLSALNPDQKSKLEDASRKVSDTIIKNQAVQLKIQQDVLGKTMKIDQALKGLRF